MPDKTGKLRLFVYEATDSLFKKSMMTKPDSTEIFEKYVGFKPIKDNEIKTFSIKEFIKPSLLIGPLNNIKVKIRRHGGTYYSSLDNSIYISQDDLRVFDIVGKVNDSLFRVHLVHEFEHAVDYFNGFNEGMSDLQHVPTEIANDIKQHVHFPPIYKDGKLVGDNGKNVSGFLYYLQVKVTRSVQKLLQKYCLT
jgi:hypothetical protein